MEQGAVFQLPAWNNFIVEGVRLLFFSADGHAHVDIYHTHRSLLGYSFQYTWQ